MALPIRVAFLAVIALAVITVASAETYTTRFDSIDVDKVIHNKRLLDNYYKCLMDQGPCGADASELKSKCSVSLKTNNDCGHGY